MSSTNAMPNPVLTTRAAGADWIKALIETTKPGITRLVTITAVVGFVLGVLALDGTTMRLALSIGLIVTVGTALSASGANALNQWWESERDARMARTLRRPLPAQKLDPTTVLKLGLLLAVAGTGVLWLAGPVPALIGISCTISYVLLYTPLKTCSAWCTLVGAVPGALPPIIGWAAAQDSHAIASVLDPGAQALFWLMMVWQIPHFMAIAWMYRDDYEKGGMRMLPVIDRQGKGTAFVVLLTAVLLIPATLAPAVALPELVGLAYPIVALISGLIFLWLCVRLARSRTIPMARKVFFASIMHLPLLLLVMVGEAFVRVVLL